MTSVRIFEDSFQRAEALCVTHEESSGMQVKRTAIMRIALDIGLDELERRAKLKGAPKKAVRRG